MVTYQKFSRLLKTLTGMINPFQSNVAFHMKTSHLISSANQMTGFHMRYNTGLLLRIKYGEYQPPT